MMYFKYKLKDCDKNKNIDARSIKKIKLTKDHFLHFTEEQDFYPFEDLIESEYGEREVIPEPEPVTIDFSSLTKKALASYIICKKISSKSDVELIKYKKSELLELIASYEKGE